MKKRSQPASAHPQPFWLRFVASLCVLLTFGMGVAQAAHHHGSWRAGNATHVEKSSGVAPAGTGEEHCQICQAMHSTLPVASDQISIAVPLKRSVVSVQMEIVPESSWHFVMFSRPPPAAAIA